MATIREMQVQQIAGLNFGRSKHTGYVVKQEVVVDDKGAVWESERLCKVE